MRLRVPPVRRIPALRHEERHGLGEGGFSRPRRWCRTSLLPLGLGAILINPFYGLVVLAGVAKPLIWFAVWRLPMTWSADD